MRRISRTLSGISFVLLASMATNPLFGSAMAARGGDRVAVQLVNKGDEVQDIKVDGKIYLVKPNEKVDVKVPAGSVVYAAGISSQHQSGDKLITITPEMKDTKVYFNCADCTVSGPSSSHTKASAP